MSRWRRGRRMTRRTAARAAAWLVAAVGLYPRTHRGPATLGGSVLMVAAMAAMAVAS